MLINRDPFARAELHKRNEYGASCAECGNQRVTKTGRRYAFRYRTEFDSIAGRASEDSRAFCSIACRRAYGASPEWR